VSSVSLMQKSRRRCRGDDTEACSRALCNLGDKHYSGADERTHVNRLTWRRRLPRSGGDKQRVGLQRALCGHKLDAPALALYRHISLHSATASGAGMESGGRRGRIHRQLRLGHRNTLTADDKRRNVQRSDRNAARAEGVLRYIRKGLAPTSCIGLCVVELFGIRGWIQLSLRSDVRHRTAMGRAVYARRAQEPPTFDKQTSIVQRECHAHLVQTPRHQHQLGLLEVLT